MRRNIDESAKSILQEIEAAEGEALEMPHVPKLDVQALDVAQVRSAVQRFAQALVGEELLADTPLMEMGLTSHLGVVLRDRTKALRTCLIMSYGDYHRLIMVLVWF